MNKLSIANKQDYAHRHSFELHFASQVIDPNITAVRWACWAAASELSESLGVAPLRVNSRQLHEVVVCCAGPCTPPACYLQSCLRALGQRHGRHLELHVQRGSPLTLWLLSGV